MNRKSTLTLQKSCKFLLLSFIFILIIHLPTYGQDPFVPKYNSVRLSQRCFMITDDTNNQFGSVWWRERVDFSQDTLFNFVVYMGSRDGDGADGLAFVLHNDPRDTLDDPSATIGWLNGVNLTQEGATGDAGGGLGYAEHNSGPYWYQRITPSVAVEFDTWFNNDPQDGTSGGGYAQSPIVRHDHTAVVYNGDLYNEQQIIYDAEGNSGRILHLKPGYAYGTDPNPDGSAYHNIEDNRCYTYQIRWIVNGDGTQTLQLWTDSYDGTTNTSDLKMVMTHTDNMLDDVFGGVTDLRFGFTGSTGGSTNEQTICLLGENEPPYAVDDYTSTGMNQVVDIFVEDNDWDPDGDELHVMSFAAQPRHGSAAILTDPSNVYQYYVQYTPNSGFVGVDSLAYSVCDVRSDKCYAKCDTAWVYITVGCDPFQINADVLQPNSICVGTLPPNGSAEASPITGGVTGVLWLEDFNDQANGTETDAGATSWNMDLTNNCFDGSADHANVQDFRIEITDVGSSSSCEVVWTSDVIDISAASSVTASVDVIGSLNMETSQDYLRVYYKIDGGAETAFGNGLFAGGNFTDKAVAAGISGNTIQIVIRSKNTSNDEFYWFDNVRVEAVGAGSGVLEYNWYAGTTPTGSPVYTGAIYNSMAEGNYTVVATDLNTGCLSDPVTVYVPAAPEDPTGGVAWVVNPVTSCDVFNGTMAAGIEYDGDTISAGYTFQWYYQESPTGTPIAIGPLVQNMEARPYSVLITDLSTGCDAMLNITLPSDVVVPLVTTQKIADVTSCTDPNTGQVSAHVGGVTSGYTFRWYDGVYSDGDSPIRSGPTQNDLPPGVYSVIATNNATLCSSDPATIEIFDLSEIPDLLVTVNSDQISCDPTNPTGSLSAVVDEGGTSTTTGYTFTWYKGFSDVEYARPGYTGGPNVDLLPAGPYYLVVEEDGTGCTATENAEIIENTDVPPVITATPTDASTCGPTANGSITIATVPPGVPNLTYQLYDGGGVVPANLRSEGASSVFNTLPVGQYTVRAGDNVTRCFSDPVTVNIADVSVIPDPILAVTDNTSCDPANPNGQIEVTGISNEANPLSDYSYSWSEVSGSAVGSVGGAFGQIAQSLDVNTYQLVIENTLTNCQNVVLSDVDVLSVIPVIDSVAVVDATYCVDPYHSEATIYQLNGSTAAPFSDFTFEWTNLDNGTTYPDTDYHIENIAAGSAAMPPGNYVVTAYDQYLCPSDPYNFEIEDATVPPTFTLRTTPNTSCTWVPGDPSSYANGTIATNYTGPNPAATYEWYRRTGAGPWSLITPTTGVPDSISGLHNEDNYRLNVIDDHGCAANQFASIGRVQADNPHIVLDSVLNVNDCGNPNGVVAVHVDAGPSTPPGVHQYDLTGAASMSQNDNGVFEWLDEGNYQVQALNTFTQCLSNIIDTAVFIVPELEFTVSRFFPATCVAADGRIIYESEAKNGTNEAGPPPIGAGFNYEWFEGINTSTPLVGKPITQPNQWSTEVNLLDAGYYTIRITDLETTCQIDTTIYLPANETPIVTSSIPYDADQCIPPNGAVDVIVDPATFGQMPSGVIADYSNYDFIIFEGEVFDEGWLNAGDGEYMYIDGATIADILNGPVPFIDMDLGTYTIVTKERFGNTCFSDPNTIEIGLDFDFPDFILSEIRPDNTCEGAPTGNGILAETSGNYPIGAQYEYAWYNGLDTSDPTKLVAGQNSAVLTTPDTLRAGMYSFYVEVTVPGPGLGCDTSGYTTLSKKIENLTPSAIFSDKTVCDADNGTAYIDDIYVDGVSQGGLTGYTDLTIYDGNLALLAPQPGNGTLAVPWTGLSDTVFFATVRNDTTFCVSEPARIDINDVTVDPDVTVVLNSPDYHCAGGTPDGELEAFSTAGDQNPAQWSFEWYGGSNTSGVPFVTNAVASQLSGNLSDSLYTVVVTDISDDDINDGCFSTVARRVPFRNTTINIDASGLDQTTCIPGGQIEVNFIQENDGVNPTSTTNAPYTGIYSLSLYDENLNAINPATDPYSVFDLATGLTPNSVPAGTYYVRAINDTLGCNSSIPEQVIIRDVSVDPMVTTTIDNPQISLNPSPATWTGAISASASEADGSIGTYTYSWYAGTDLSNYIINGSGMTNLDSGYYTVRALNTNTNCEVLFTDYVPLEVRTPEFLYDLEPQRNCAVPDGSITIHDITLDGNPDLMANYNFYFYDGTYVNDLSLASSTIPGVDPSIQYPDLAEGYYYVVARQNDYWYLSLPVQVYISDNTVFPVITLDQANSNPMTSCDPSISANGSLTVTATEETGIPASAYSYQWYSGANVNPSNIITGATNSVISNRDVGTYTVLVVNADNGCENNKSFIIEDESVIPIVSATSTPVTFCPPEMADGVVNASVIDATTAYDYYWYEGTEATGSWDHPERQWTNRPIGFYTVVAINQAIPECVSDPVTVEVEDGTKIPELAINEVTPITNCDPENPNGKAYASSDGGITGFTFDWYLEGDLYSTGPMATNLGDNIYQVVVINNTTLCKNTGDYQPNTQQEDVPEPQLDEKVSRTSCSEANGGATASVNGDVTSYQFLYFKADGTPLDISDRNSISDLDTGRYFVIARDRITKCDSDPVPFGIDNDMYIPDFQAITNPSSCEDPTGTIEVIVSDKTREYQVRWSSDNGLSGGGDYINYMPVGTYLIEVEGSDGCIDTTNAIISADVIIYNGVSDNFDGLNDVFQVVCLEMFMNNNVKIFNRSGMLVYEMDRYDMNDPERSFHGIANRGLNLGTGELPVGTYFYVIDLGDGSKPRVGYLELTR